MQASGESTSERRAGQANVDLRRLRRWFVSCVRDALNARATGYAMSSSRACGESVANWPANSAGRPIDCAARRRAWYSSDRRRCSAGKPIACSHSSFPLVEKPSASSGAMMALCRRSDPSFAGIHAASRRHSASVDGARCGSCDWFGAYEARVTWPPTAAIARQICFETSGFDRARRADSCGMV